MDVPAQARAAAPPPVKGIPQPVIGAKPQVRPPWRAHPEVITPEAEEGVYGAATPLIVEWRQARAAFLDKGGSRVERACGWGRMCELALVLIGEHELTLPPETYPWDTFRRERELWEQQQSLRDARWERRRALCWRLRGRPPRGRACRHRHVARPRVCVHPGVCGTHLHDRLLPHAALQPSRL